MYKPTEEQTAIISSLKAGKNIQVDAVAGGGKTTTALLCAAACPEKTFLILTYNRMLRQNTEDNIKKWNLCDRVKTKTIHSAAASFYKRNRMLLYSPSMISSYDAQMYEMMNFAGAFVFMSETTNADVIVIDEAQDLTPLYASFLKRLILDMEPIQIIIMGDTHQCIYKQQGADPVYLTNPTMYFGDPENEWEYLTLTRTFRMNSHIVDFVNGCLPTPRIQYRPGNTTSKKIGYACGDVYNSVFQKKILKWIDEKCTENNWSADDIMIIAENLKPKTSSQKPSALAVLENLMSSRGRRYTRTSEKDNSTLVSDTILISSLQASKGLERNLVVVFSFDEYYRTREFPSRPPLKSTDPMRNEMYVALTRAKEELLVVHYGKSRPMPYFDQENFELDYINIGKDGVKSLKSRKMNDQIPFDTYSVTDLLEHKKGSELDKLVDKYLTVESITAKSQYNIDHVERDEMIPYTKFIGSAVTEYHRYLSHKVVPYLYDPSIRRLVRRNDPKVSYIIKRDLYHSDNITFADILFLTVLKTYIKDGFSDPIENITSYEWFDDAQVIELMNRFPDTSRYLYYEKPVTRECDSKFGRMNVCGAIDIHHLGTNVVYEIKYTSDLSSENVLQTGSYLEMTGLTKGVLINTRTGKTISVTLKAQGLVQDLVDLHETV